MAGTYPEAAHTGVLRARRWAAALACAVIAGAAWWSGDESPRAPAPVRYDGLAAVRVEPRTPDELAAVLATSDDVWTESVAPGRPVVAVMARDEVAALAARGVPHEIVVEDIQAVADAERTRLAARDGTDWFSEYRDVDEVAAYVDRLAERYPDTARTRQLGTSIEDRPIRAIEISRGGEVGIVLNGGHHAREWISVMVPLCIADRLLATHGTDPRVRDILESVTFYVAPLVNPDGYHYSWTFDRYWRKNRRGGYGVDLNRNYSVGWGGAGSSSDQASPTYRGTRPFSEPESRALRALFEAEDVRGHVDFHSYSQLILYPWSHRLDDPPDRDAFAAIADRMSSAIHAVHGERYDVIPGSELGGGVSGTVADWAYGEGGALSFLIELRPAGGRAGFVLPPEQIVPTCDESYAAVLELSEWLMRHPE